METNTVEKPTSKEVTDESGINDEIQREFDALSGVDPSRIDTSDDWASDATPVEPSKTKVKDEQDDEETGDHTGESAGEEKNQETDEAEEPESAEEEESTEETDEETNTDEEEVAEATPKWLEDSLKDFRENDDESFEDTLKRVTSKVSDLESKLQAEDEANEKLATALEQNPSVMRMLQRLVNDGYDPIEALASEFDLEEIQEIISDDKAQEKLAERRVTRKQQKKELEQRAQKSEQVAKDFYKKHDFGEDQIQDFNQKVKAVIDPVMKGELTQEFMDLMYKGLQYEQELDRVRKQTAKKVSEQTRKNSKTKRKGDGLPTGKRSGNNSNPNRKSTTIGGVSLDDVIGNDDWAT